jgi:alpha-glucuronidase
MLFSRRPLPVRALRPVLLAVLLVAPAAVRAETGHDLWLRYVRLEDASGRAALAASASAVAVPGGSPTARITSRELRRGIAGLTGAEPRATDRVRDDGTILVGTPADLSVLRGAEWVQALSRAGESGFVIRPARVDGHRATVVAARTDVGALYGVFALLRHLQAGGSVSALNTVQRPRIENRILDHWDNLDGTIERGYAGSSLWKWSELPTVVDGRIEEYARANASIGLNGTVLNNVNASPASLTKPYLEKTAAIAAVLRPYGIRVYLSANFNAPRSLGGLATADPLDPGVARWWKEKADEIYTVIPDFGGFLVKANSEGQPGPQDYKRTHADGANMLADAVAPHGGIVMWRAFVYSADVDPDRVKRAYLEFVPLDGTFRPNVIVQVKNGPLDFMPREPFSPLFGAMPKTPLMAELQITQEYLGQSNHLVYLAPMWKEFLDADTYAAGPGSLVAKVVDGTLHGYRRTAIAGVANTGSDANWTGHDFAQANWYAFGRLAWDPSLTSEAIADEWIRMTWSRQPTVVAAIRGVMLGSRETFVNYTMPLGLHHLIGGDHYAPMPENDDPRRLDWSATYYHRADAGGVGFDRTRKGSKAVDQYRPPLNDRFNDPATCPEKLLLWFHHLPWDDKLASGRTVWQELVRLYAAGAAGASKMEAEWKTLGGKVDADRHRAVSVKMRRQAADAAAWREHILEYFRQFSKRPL